MRVDEFPPEGAVTSRVLPVVRTPEPTLEMKPREAASLVRQVPVHFGLGEQHLPDEAVGVHSRHMADPG